MVTQRLAGPSSTPSRKVKIPVKARPLTALDIRAPSFANWAAMGAVRLWEAILLSMNIEPSARALKALKPIYPQKYREYLRRLRIAKGQLGIGLQPYENHANEGEGPVDKVVALTDFIEYMLRHDWPERLEVAAALSERPKGDSYDKREAKQESSKLTNNLLLLLHEFCSNQVVGFNINSPGASARAIEQHFLHPTRRWRLPVDKQTIVKYVKQMPEAVANFDRLELQRVNKVDPLRMEDTKSLAE